MANRVLLDANGLKISKPGFNVLTAPSTGLLMDTTDKMLQVIDSGIESGIAWNGSRAINIPTNLGFVPFILAYSPNSSVRVTYSSNNSQVTFTQQRGPRENFNVYWLVLNIARQ